MVLSDVIILCSSDFPIKNLATLNISIQLSIDLWVVHLRNSCNINTHTPRCHADKWSPLPLQTSLWWALLKAKIPGMEPWAFNACQMQERQNLLEVTADWLFRKQRWNRKRTKDSKSPNCFNIEMSSLGTCDDKHPSPQFGKATNITISCLNGKWLPHSSASVSSAITEVSMVKLLIGEDRAFRMLHVLEFQRQQGKCIGAGHEAIFKACSNWRQSNMSKMIWYDLITKHAWVAPETKLSLSTQACIALFQALKHLVASYSCTWLARACELGDHQTNWLGTFTSTGIAGWPRSSLAHLRGNDQPLKAPCLMGCLGQGDKKQLLFKVHGEVITLLHRKTSQMQLQPVTGLSRATRFVLRDWS